MTTARRIAEHTARNHGRDPWKVASRLGVRVSRARLPGRHREMYVERHGLAPASAVVIATDADDAEARELLAHALGHHLMHAGDRVSGQSQAVWSGRHEREAEDFAALLLAPDYRLAKLAGGPEAHAVELAESCGISLDLARRRLRLGWSLELTE